MNKQLLTGLTIIGVAGSAGVAYAGVSVIHSASADESPAISQAPMPVTRTIVYQVGGAGQVSIAVSGDHHLAVSSSSAASGWTVVGASAGERHAEVQFPDGLQLVTFMADLVGTDVAVSVTNVEAAGAPSTTVAAPLVDISVLSDSGTPQPQPAPTPVVSPSPTTPSHAGTTAPSASGGDDDDDEHEDDEHEEEHEDEDDD